MIRKRFVIFIISVLFLTGCGHVYNHFHESLKTIDTLVEHKKWKEASKELNQMQMNYEKKLQYIDFYIVPEDYTLLVELIGELKGAIKEKDRKQALKQITAMETVIKKIYYK
ncbi:DUF4363 family protein [Virgibacillus oceani]|uniref:DUF4363 domain-containing protein n=1 Tax=Virgibacillus oceani TaxID=1479511 RepID=A0A917HRP3_9BACI|nr:DUF4363 family protein [Virgibacillus oceani]GGG87209.1 hypothetical protein GCM10011398_36310 [Virgibacillus oceani]